MRAGRQRHVESIVDEDSCAGVADGGDASRHEAREISGLHVVFPDLHEIHTGRGSSRNALYERIFRRESAAVRDHADDWSHATVTLQELPC
jgi:hypothetical protein